MSPEETQRLVTWVADAAPHWLTDVSPDMVTDAVLSRAVRLRWFSLRLHGIDYKVGLNIHYAGAFGALWIVKTPSKEPGVPDGDADAGEDDADADSISFHPHAAPRHGFGHRMLHSFRDTLRHHKEGHALVHKVMSNYRQ